MSTVADAPAAAPRAARKTKAKAGLPPADAKFWRGVVFVCALVPAAMLAMWAIQDRLGANPVDFVLDATGRIALALLCLSLAVTPMRWLGLAWTAPLRRTIGLTAFGYAAVHASIYLELDQALALGPILLDVAKRPFITVGAVTFGILCRLTWTSGKKAPARYGKRRWEAIHRGAYAAALLGVLHFALLVKLDRSVPYGCGAVVLALLLARVIHTARKVAARP